MVAFLIRPIGEIGMEGVGIVILAFWNEKHVADMYLCSCLRICKSGTCISKGFCTEDGCDHAAMIRRMFWAATPSPAKSKLCTDTYTGTDMRKRVGWCVNFGTNTTAGLQDGLQ